MKYLIKYNIFFLLQSMLFLSLSLQAQDPNFHIYLCFGQSNMDGTGAIENQDKVTNSRVKMLQGQTCSNLGRNFGTWYTAVPPLSRCWNGLGPADQFGKEMASKMPANVTIGLVVTGYGGCDIAFFQKGAPLGKASFSGGAAADIPSQFTGGYAWMLDLAKKAQTVGVIKGMIFHQGETNTNDQNWKYKVQEIVNNLRTDLGIGNVPFLAGELLYSQYGGCCSSHNTEINKLPGLIPNCQVVSSSGLAGKDNAHFTSASYRELGIRYAQKMLPLVNVNSSPSPIVTITNPNVNSSLCTGSSVNIAATATITTGSISKVDFYDGGTLLGTDNSAPYSFVWQNPPTGSHTLRAIATSAENVTSDPANVLMTVFDPTVIKPVMQLNGAAWTEMNSASLCEGGSLGIGPHPYDVSTGWSWTGPGNFTSSVREITFTDIKPAQSGTYNVTFTDANNCSNSLSIPVTVHAKPAITITSPSGNSVITSNPVDIDIEASVTGNNISNVQFMNGTTLLGQDGTAPYSFSWDNVTNGTYSITVRATDANNCTNSESVSFTVNNVVTSLEEGEYNDKSICYPNPFHHQFTISPGAELEFAIMDVIGNVKEQGVTGSKIQVGKSLTPGIYFLKVNGNSEEKMIKIIKE